MLFWRALLFSVFLHGLLFALLLFRPRSELKPQVLYVELPAQTAGTSGKVGEGGSKSGAKRGGKKSLPRDWTWRGSSSGGSIAGGSGGSAGAASFGKGNEVFSFAAGMGIKEEAKFYPWAEKIYKRVDGYIGYPADFVEENISGNVTLHFKVDERGRFLGKFLEVEGDEDLLKVYTMAMIVLALRDPIFPPSEKKEIPVAVNVQYRLLLPDEFTGRKANFHFKNGFQFDRVGHTDAKAIKQARRLMDKYIPPIIPVPGGFFIDFVALYKKIKEIDGNDEYWRRGIRMELDHQELELLIKKSVS
jgi:hypothetical protein